MNPFETLDLTDKKIIELLQKNPNITYSDLAKAINKSQPAIGARILKLNRSGFSGLTYGINFKSANLPLFLCNIESNEPNRVLDRANCCPFILNVFNRTGQMNLSILATASSYDKFNEIVDPCFRKDKSIQHITTIPIMKIINDFILPMNLNIELYEKLNCSNECPFKDKKDFPTKIDQKISIVSILEKEPQLKSNFDLVFDSILNLTGCFGGEICFIDTGAKISSYLVKKISSSFINEMGLENLGRIYDYFLHSNREKNYASNYESIILNNREEMDGLNASFKDSILSICDRNKYRCMSIIPIKSNEIVFGILILVGTNENLFREEVVDKLESSANHIATAIFNLLNA